MKLALISDIHGNLPALEAVLNSIENERVDEIICLGDIVGYGAQPNECLDILISRNIPCIMGNHDCAATGGLALSILNNHARVAIEWTIRNLSESHRNFLKQMPYDLVRDNLLFVHSSPDEPAMWHYIFNVSDAAASFRKFDHVACFIGHTHFPAIFTNPSDGRRLINVGSVGQPRDRDPRSCYGIFDTSTLNFRWIRVEYPIETAAKQIVEAGLPEFLAQRLTSGI